MIAGHLSSYRPMRGSRLAVALAGAAVTVVAAFAADVSGAHRPHRRSGEYHSGRRRAARSSRSSPISKRSPASSSSLPPSTRSKARRSSPTPTNCSAAWKLGEKAKNNGVLLLVAPKERRVRIEVGYGLEGTLTDALAKVIITNAITPRFKTGDFGGGISRGVDDIITVLTTDASEWEKRPSLRLDNQPANDPTQLDYHR